MLWTLFAILVGCWLLGVLSGAALGGYVHLLLVLAAIVLLAQFVANRRTV